MPTTRSRLIGSCKPRGGNSAYEGGTDARQKFWIKPLNLLQPVHVTKVCVHVKKSVVVAVLHETAIFREVPLATIASS